MLHSPEKYYCKKVRIEKIGSQSFTGKYIMTMFVVYMDAGDQCFALKFYEVFVAHATLQLEEENLVICRWGLALWGSYTLEIHSQIKFKSEKTDLTVVTVQLGSLLVY